MYIFSPLCGKTFPVLQRVPQIDSAGHPRSSPPTYKEGLTFSWNSRPGTYPESKELDNVKKVWVEQQVSMVPFDG